MFSQQRGNRQNGYPLGIQLPRPENKIFQAAIVLDLVMCLWAFIKVYMFPEQLEVDNLMDRAYGFLPKLVWKDGVSLVQSVAIMQC